MSTYTIPAIITDHIDDIREVSQLMTSRTVAWGGIGQTAQESARASAAWMALPTEVQTACQQCIDVLVRLLVEYAEEVVDACGDDADTSDRALAGALEGDDAIILDAASAAGWLP
jgi:hypothetical protein